MSLARLLSHKHISAEALRFLLGGGVNTLLSYAIYWLLLPWLSYPVAYTISYAAAIFTGFAISTWFVFRAPWSWHKLAAFPLVQLFNYLLGLGTVTVCVRYLGIDAKIAPVLATVIVLPANFLLTRSLMRLRVQKG
ncbi:GtrA family protein [Rhodanobacter thiooxydans]|uniref:GtrA family protein n=1 Tax=Rhodanobacter thiooxydans TaxID=416169 RepID=UPI000260D621|nr:GtrA family protein [Rhodanobacter thiooxydans]EIL98452.1 membrane protein involved in synthesis of cell surface polysaccharides [Rhodanobacter thiooxydans LCS2]